MAKNDSQTETNNYMGEAESLPKVAEAAPLKVEAKASTGFKMPKIFDLTLLRQS